MTAVFEKILEMSLTSAVVIAVVLVIRLCLRKAPRKYSYALWSVAAFRLVCPVSFQAVFSLFRLVRTVEGTQVVQTVTKPVPTVTPGYFDSVPPGHLGSVPPVEFDPDYLFTYPLNTPPAAEIPWYATVDWVRVAAIVWLVGLAALLIYGVVSYVLLRRRMSTAVVLEGNVWQSDRVQSPFILGLFRPKIYLPFGLTDGQRRYVLAHERYHIKRLDHMVRPLSYLILAVHWFNPFVWLAYYLMARDMEMSCDEKVLSTEENIRKEYSTTLLSFAANRRFPSPSPLAFGESGVKGRIKNALNWKKPRTWVTVIAVIVCIVVIVVCAANPKEPYSPTESLFNSTSTATAEGLSSGYLSTENRTGNLSEEERTELAALLNRLSIEDFEKAESLMSYLDNASIRIVFTWGSLAWNDGQLYIGKQEFSGGSVKEHHIWTVNNAALEQFIRDLPDTTEQPTSDLPDYLPYKSVKCVYMSPLSSYVSANGDSGYSYMIGEDRVSICRKTGVGNQPTVFEDLPDWRTLTGQEWKGMFEFDMAPDISGYVSTPLIRELSADYALVRVDGDLWMVELRGGYVWSVYELAPDTHSATLAEWSADLTGDGVEEAIVLEGVILEGYARYASAGLTAYDAAGNILWQHGTAPGFAESSDLHLVTYNGKKCLLIWMQQETDTYRWYGYRIVELNADGSLTPDSSRMHSMRFDLDDRSLLELDIGAAAEFLNPIQELREFGTLLAGSTTGELVYSTPDNPIRRFDYGLVSELGDLKEQVTSRFDPVVWQADLTHDGVDETITVREVYQGDLYELTVTKADGTAIWSAEAAYAHAGHNGIYLYEHDGFYYLMQWLPYMSTGSAAYTYRIFGLNEDGREMKFADGGFSFSENFKDELMSIDISALRAFEDEINSLLADAIVLLSTNEFKFSYSTPDDPVTHQWTSPADRLEERQQDYLAEDAKRQANTLATWPLNDLTVTVLKTGDEEVYTLDVYGNDYFFWSTELRTRPGYGDTLYLLYRENGKEYLAEFTGSSRQGIGTYSYRVFTVRPESLDILYENSLYYDFMSEETALTVDLEAIRAFEDEVNGLFLHNADIICGIGNGQMFWNPGGTDTEFYWRNPDFDRIQQAQQDILDQMPIVINYAALDQEFRDVIEAQMKLRMGSHGLARVQTVEEIPTGAVSLTEGHFLYRVSYLPGDYDADANQILWQEEEQHFYLVTHEDWSGTPEWWFVAALDEEELQSRFHTPEMLAQYGDPYLAAVVETVRQWREAGSP